MRLTVSVTVALSGEGQGIVLSGYHRVHLHVRTYQNLEATAHSCVETGRHDAHGRAGLAVLGPSADVDDRSRLEVLKARGNSETRGSFDLRVPSWGSPLLSGGPLRRARVSVHPPPRRRNEDSCQERD